MIAVMSYKAIIFDLDGTAIPNKFNGRPSQLLIEAVGKAQDSIKLCAATGRSIAMAKNILSALKLKDPCIVAAGTQIINPLTSEVLWEVTLQPNDVKEILRICTPYQYEVLVKDELLGEGGKAISRVSVEEDINVIYIMGCAQTDALTILTEVNKLDGVTAAGVSSWSDERVDVHITNKDATKEHSVAELLKILGLKKDEVIGVGDGDNDMHLFAGVGFKVAMGNGTDRLKALADEITASVDDDGLVKTINKYR